MRLSWAASSEGKNSQSRSYWWGRRFLQKLMESPTRSPSNREVQRSPRIARATCSEPSVGHLDSLHLLPIFRPWVPSILLGCYDACFLLLRTSRALSTLRVQPRTLPSPPHLKQKFQKATPFIPSMYSDAFLFYYILKYSWRPVKLVSRPMY
jgi:hypothetical protein